MSFQLMENTENNPDSGEETDQGDDIQAIGNFESSNQGWSHLRLKNDIHRFFFLSS